MNAAEKWAELSEAMVLTDEQVTAHKQIALDHAPAALADLDAASFEEEQFYALPQAAFATYHLERWDHAKTYAERALTLAANFTDNWNFGNAVYTIHTIAGLLALRQGDRAAAVDALLASGATRGSPQLNSFGPTMQLAIALLDVGERDAVLSFLTQCAAFWKMGGSSLAIWQRKIAAGEMPNFFGHRSG